MCFSLDAQPPDLPRHYSGAGGQLPPGVAEHGGVSSTERLVLTSHDSTQFAATLARPESPTAAGIVILPDNRGLFPFYEELAERFAVAGVEAIAIDYFGRTAGVAPRDQDFDPAPHLAQTQPEQVAQDVAAAVAYLKALPGRAPEANFTVGFCFGGGNSLLQAANHLGLAGVIAFYGSPVVNRRGGPAPIDRISDYECPVLGLFGGDDRAITVEDVRTYENALNQAGVENEIVVYPGAPHSFFDKRNAEFQEQSADAWERVLRFIAAHTPHMPK